MFNKACERATGYRAEEVEGHDMVELLVAAEDGPRIRRALGELVAGHHRSVLESDWLTAKGPRRRIAWSNSVLLDDAGEVTHIVRIGMDVTHERELEQQLLATQRVETLGQLASGIAHDFNNLLSIIRGHVELVSDLDGMPPDARRRLEAIDSAVRRGSALTANLTRLDRSAPEVLEVLHVNEATESLSRLLVDVLGVDVVLELNLAAADDRVHIDSTGFEQVLLNLVLNACDAMAGHGVVTIATQSAADAYGRPGVLMTVADTGAGMDAPTLARVFEPFFTTKAQSAGSGLGLATARLIVDSAGGAITADSTPGDGAVISVWYPRATEEVDAAEEVAPPPRHDAPATGARILVVDDDPWLLSLIATCSKGRDSGSSPPRVRPRRWPRWRATSSASTW